MKTKILKKDNVKQYWHEDSIIIVWDPNVLTKNEYARLIVAIGDLVRAEGGIGVIRNGSFTSS